MRSFLAVAVREPALTEARRMVDELAGRLSEARCRWVRGEGLHLTLHFFGELDEAWVGEVLEAVSPAAAAAAPFDLELGGLGSFPPRGAPRALWIGVTAGTRPLTTLATACRGGLRAAGFEVEERPFSAHCTIGRPKPGWPAVARAAWAQEVAAAVVLPPFRVSAITLYRSRPLPTGAEYSVVAEVPLGPR